MILLLATMLTQGPISLVAFGRTSQPAVAAAGSTPPRRAQDEAESARREGARKGRVRQETQAERDASVARIRVEPENPAAVIKERLPLGATAFDAKGVPVGGVGFNWRLTGGPAEQAEVSPDGVFAARAPGEYEVTVEGGAHVATVKVSVSEKAARATGAPDQPQGILDESRYIWNEENFRAARRPENQRGARAEHPPAVNGNFSFKVPILSLPGRGLDLDLGLTYNSRVWTAAPSPTSSASNVTYDIDRDWPAPGWTFSLPKVAFLGAGGAMIVEGDGTRRPFAGETTHTQGASDYRFDGNTTDGSLIKYRTNFNGCTAHYPDGTVINFSGAVNSAGVGIGYVNEIRDVNGNYITVRRDTSLGQGGPITSIVDTLGRTVFFYYDSRKLLTAITVAGPKDEFGNASMRTLARFHYRKLRLSYSFTGMTPLVRNGEPYVIDAIYFPATGTGYWFGDFESYSSFGMLRKVSQQRGMGFSAATADPDDSLNVEGEITPGSVTVEREYDYPLAATASLSEPPTYSQVKESWEGMEGDPRVTRYEVHMSQTPRKVKITQPDNTYRIQYSENLSLLNPDHPDKFKDGLLKEEEFYDAAGTLLTKSKVVAWEKGYLDTPRPTRLENYVYRPGRAALMSAVEVTYGAKYNTPDVKREYDYTGALLRTTRTTYKHLDATFPNSTIPIIYNVNLVEAQEVFAGPTTGTRLSYTLNAYDEEIPTVVPPNVVQFLRTDGARGRLTSSTTYADSAGATGGLTQKYRYDIFGNVVSNTDPAGIQTDYAFNSSTIYAYASSMAVGPPGAAATAKNRISTVYDFNSGLIVAAADLNGRETRSVFDPASARRTRILLPTGARTEFSYDDFGMAVTKSTYGADGRLAGKGVSYLNGVGMAVRQESLTDSGRWSVVDTSYDLMNRVKQESRPYFRDETPRRRSKEYDVMGRLTTVTEPDGSVSRIFYDDAPEQARPLPAGAQAAPGITVRTVDPWGRERWALLNSDGKIIEVVEPNRDSAGPVGADGYLTRYTYDALSRLTGTNQSGQLRSFKLDGLGRMTHSKLAEKAGTLNASGQYVGATPNGWSGFVGFDDKGRLSYVVDARGVKSEFAYNDPLSRLTSVKYVVPANASERDNSSPILPAAETRYDYKTDGDLFRVSRLTTDPVNTPELQAPGSTEDYEYDAEGRLRQKTLVVTGRGAQPLVVNYEYDELGRLKEQTYPDQYGTNLTRKKLRPQYGFGSQQTGLFVNETPYASQGRFDAAGVLRSLTVGPAGMFQETESFDYDEFTGLLKGQTVKRGGTTLLDLSYDYLRPQTSGGRTGQVTRILNNLDHSKDRAYSYDALGRLSKVTGGASAWWQQYAYDPYGNRESISKGGVLAAAPGLRTLADDVLAEVAALAEAPALDSFLNPERRDVTDAPKFSPLAGAPPAPEPAAAFVDFDAAYISQSIATTMTATQLYPASVVMRNTGSKTWWKFNPDSSGQVQLCLRPQPGNLDNWQATEPLIHMASPGNSQFTTNTVVTFNNWWIRAPQRAGTYRAQWQMCRQPSSGRVFFGQAGPLVEIQVAPMSSHDAIIVSQSIPTTMSIGATYTATITIKNNGSWTWTPSTVWLHSLTTGFESLVEDDARISLPRNVAPGETIELSFPVRAPFEPGSYKTRWKMRQTPHYLAGFGDATPELTVNVSRPAEGALFTAQRVPTRMVAGQSYPVTVTMKNSGANLWQAGQGYALGSLDPADNMTWGLNRVALPLPTLPTGLDVNFDFNVTAPATPGRYSFQWGMLSNTSGGFFGEPSTRLVVDVSTTAPTPTPTPSATPTPVPKVNVALSFNGGVASASSSEVTNGAARINDGNRMGTFGNARSWLDQTPGVFPDWAEVSFNGVRRVSEINVISGQEFNMDVYPPNLSMVFMQAGNIAFDVAYWNDAAGTWALVPGGNVTGNDRVWRRFTFPEISTSKVRVYINDAVTWNTRYSHLVELEAYETVLPAPTPQPTPQPTPEPEQRPFNNNPAAVPGVIQAEDYDHGGEGVAYHDLDAFNHGGHRPAEGVDVETTADAGGGQNVGWLSTDEWLEYTVKVPTTGLYKLEARVASEAPGRRLRFDFDGVAKSGEMLVPNTGGHQTWQTINAFVTLQAGVQVMRAYVTAGGGGFNLNYVRLTAVSPASQPVNLAKGKTATQSSDFGVAFVAPLAVDGNTDGNSATGSVSSTNMALQSWWEVDLGSVQSVDNVQVYNRTDCCSERLSNFHVFVSDNPFTSSDPAATLAQPGVSHIYLPGQSGPVSTLTVNSTGRYVRVQLDDENYLSMAEVQVWGSGAPVSGGLLADDFNDNALDALKWVRMNASSGVTVQETNQRLEITPPAATSTHDGYASVNPVDLTDARAVVEVPHASTGQYTETRLGLWAGVNRGASMAVREGNLYLQLIEPALCDMCGPDSVSFNEESLVYSPTQHRYWRVRHDAATDTIKWETSADASTWQVRRSASRPFAVTGLTVKLSAGNTLGVTVVGGGTPPAADAAFFDNFKVELNNPNNPPTVSITAPLQGAVFTAPASSTIKAVAGDADGSIVKVEFYSGGLKLGEDTAAPYEVAVTNALPGSYTLTAKAYDNRAAVTTSAPVTVTVTQPTVNVAAAAAASEPAAAGSFTVTRSGDTAQPLVVSLGYAGTATAGTDYAPLPATLTIPAGQSAQTVQVVPVDDALAEGKETVVVNLTASSVYALGGNPSATVELRDNDNFLPAVTLTSPKDAASFTPPLPALNLTADASDADGSIVKVEFYSGLTKLGEDAAAPYGFTWANVGTGTYSLTARAIDNSGAITTSAAAVVNVTSVASFADDFNDNATDLSKWTVVLPAGGTVAEQNQRLELTPPAAAVGYSGYTSKPYLDLTGGRAAVEVVQSGQAIYGMETYFTLSDPASGNQVLFAVNGAGFVFYQRAAGVVTSTTIGYDGVQYRHWRFRHDPAADTLNWETSADGVNWTARRTAPRAFALTNLQVHFYAGKYTATTPASTAIFDNFRATRYQTLAEEFNSAPPRQALLVVGATALTASDAALKSRLESLGFTVAVQESLASSAADANGKHLVVISESCPSANVTTKFRDVAVPALVMEMQVYDDMQMTGPTLGTDYQSEPSHTLLPIINPSHPLAAGLSGTVTVTTSPLGFGWGRPGANAVRVATMPNDSTKATVFAYEGGAAMVGLAAPARRVGLFPMQLTPAGLNSNGWALFDAAARWSVKVGTLDTSRWEYFNPESANAVSLIDQQLRITLQPNTTGFLGVQTAATYDLRDRTLRAEVPQTASQTGSVWTTLGARLDDRNMHSFSAGAGSLHLDAMTAGVNNRTSVAYDAARHRHWRLRHNVASNTMSFETSANGQNWETLKTVPVTFDLSAVRVALIAGATDNANNWPGAAVYDNVFIHTTEANRPPAVQITAPAEGATFIAPATADITADASDPDGVVAKVEFFAGATKLGEDTNAPFSLTITNAVAGAYALTAKATDNSGATATSAVRNVTVTTPVVTVAAADANASEQGPNTGEFTVTRTGPTAAALAVNLGVGGTAASGADYTALPATLTIPAGAASAAVQVTPTDDLTVESDETVVLTVGSGAGYAVGAPASAAVTIGDNDLSPPSISIINPLNGATFITPAAVQIDTLTPVTGNPISKVEFFAGATKIGEDTNAPFNFNWDGVAAGTYSLTAKATTESSAFTLLPVGNAGFEAPALGSGFQYTPTGGTWTFVGGTGVSANSSGFTNGNPPAPEGAQVAIIQGGNTSHFSQQVSGFQANTNYAVTFAAAQRGNCCPAGHDFDVYLDTTLLGTFRPAGTGYASMSTPVFTTTAGTHTLKFVGRNSSGGDNTSFVDGVRVLGSTRQALLVVGATALTASDAALKSRLEALGFTVTVRESLASVTDDATAKSLVVISESCPSANVTTKFRDVAVPALVMEMQVYDDMQMTGPTLGTDYNSESNHSQLIIADASHPLAAGLTGTPTVTTSPLGFGWGRPGANAVRVATMPNDSTKATVFAYEGGAAMVGLTAPARRVGLFPMQLTPAGLNSSGWALFDAAVRWGTGITTNSVSATSAPVNITVNLPTVTVAATDANASETGPDPGSFTVTRNGPTTAPLTVQLAPGGTATAVNDYAALGASVTIPAGSNSAAVQVSPVDDADVETGGEVVTLMPAANAAYTVGQASPASVQIDDNDTHPPTVMLIKPTNGVTFTAPADITLVATANDVDGTIAKVEFFADGEKLGEDTTAPSFTFDWANVGPRAYTLTAVATDNAGVSVTSAPVNISVNLPTVTAAAADANASETGSDPGSFTVTRDGSNAEPLTVGYEVGGTASGGVDYAALAGTVIIPAGSNSATVKVVPVDDSTVEAGETVVLSLSTRTTYNVGVPNGATVQIADNDAPVRVNVALAANGATAAGATTHPDPSFVAARAINGSRGADGGYWNDATPDAFPDSLEITFAGAKLIDEIDVYGLQDNLGSADPNEAMTFSQYGLRDFDLKYWDAAAGAWLSVPGASASSNNKVWRKFVFAPLTTSKIKLTVYNALATWSRVVEVEAYQATNLALGKAVAQSSTLVHTPPGDAWRAVDGNTDGNYSAGSVTHTNGESQPWWQVDLGSVQAVSSVKLWNRTDCCSERLADFHVFVSDNPFTSNTVAGTQTQPGVSDYHVPGLAGAAFTQQIHRTGRYVRVQLSGTGVLSLAEVEVWRDGAGVTSGCPAQFDLPAELFVRNFYEVALARQPNAAELQQAGDALRAGRAQGEPQLIAAAQTFGRSLFFGSEYAARNRTNRDFVWDLYWAYLSYGPDQLGWNFWKEDVDKWGRAAKLPAFDTYPDFTNQVRRICPDLPYLNQPPVAVAGGPYAGAASVPVQFNGAGSHDPDGTLVAQQWNFGDELTATGLTPLHTYALGGTRPVMLMVKDNRGALRSASTTATIQGPQVTTNEATFVSQNVPATMNAGQTYNVSVTLRNSGTSTWTADANFALGAVNPVDSAVWKVVGEINGRVKLPAQVAPGADAVFNFKVVAPSTPGQRNFQRRMLQHGADWFGDATTNAVVNVVGPVEVPTDGAAGLSYDPASNRINTAGYAYDADGNLTRQPAPAGTAWQRMRYDAAGRLVHVLADDNTTVLVTHTYGEHRNRLSTYEGGLRTFYVWSAGAVIAEFVEHDTTPNQLRWSKNYVYFDGSLLAVQSAEGGDAEYLEFHHPDRLGSRLVTSPTRGDQFEQTTLPFGNTFGAESGNVDRKAFAGYDRSFQTGLDYVVNRFYSAHQGRFTQVDPIGFGASSLDTPQSLNLYAYVNNDPVNQTDPDGLTGFLWPSFFSFGIGFGWGGQSGFGIRTIVNGQYFSNWFWFGGPPQPAPPPPPPPIIHTPVSSNTSSNSVSTGSVQTTTMTTDVDFSHVLSDEALSRERFMFATFVNASFQGDGYQSVVLPASEADLQKYMKHGPYLDGECAKFPQVVAWANLIKIGQTDTWIEGPRVVDSPRLQRGTIIASGWNANRRYPGEETGNHVAIFLYFLDPRDPFKGFAVIEQVGGKVGIDYKVNRQVNYYYSHPEWYAVVLTKPEKVEPPKPRTPAPARRGRGRRGE